MSDHWEHYFAKIDDFQASILYDEGLADTIDELPQDHALCISLQLRDPAPSGFPEDDEAGRLQAIEDQLEAECRVGHGLLLGRVTTNGRRQIMFLLHANSEPLVERVEALVSERGYTADVLFQHDPARRIYWVGLYPTEEDRRVMNDMKVISSLNDHGDDCLAERKADHWTYFDSESSAEDFARWLRSKEYSGVSVEEQVDSDTLKSEWLVRSISVGSMRLDDISQHTLKHLRKAAEFGGRYDGWETEVIRKK